MQILTITLVSAWAHFVPEDESHVHKSTEQMNNQDDSDLFYQGSLPDSLE